MEQLLARRLTVIASLLVACSALGQTTAKTSHTAAKPRSNEPTAANLQRLLGKDKLLRDFAPFRTERDEPAALLLYVIDAQTEVGPTCDDKGTPCFCDFGTTMLDGNYFVALTIKGKLVNAVPIELENGSLPLVTDHRHKVSLWGDGTLYPEGDARNERSARVE